MAARDFPIEVWTLIFKGNYYSRKDLYQHALINKRCYAVTNPKLWYGPSGNNRNGTSLFNQLLTGILSAEQYNKAHNITPSQTLGQHIRQLPALNITMTDPLLSLLTRTPLLTELSLSLACVGNEEQQKFTNATLSRFPQHCPGLTHLTLENMHIDAKLMTSLSQHCKQLKDLTIDGGTLASPKSLRPLADLPLTNIMFQDNDWVMTGVGAQLAKITTLKSLSLWDIHDGYSILCELVPTTANNNTTGLPHLTNFSFCPEYPDALDWKRLLDDFFKSHTLLEDVKLGECGLHNSNLKTIGKHLINLSHLQIYGHRSDCITGEGIRYLATKSRTLQSVELDDDRSEPLYFGHLGRWTANSFDSDDLYRIRNKIRIGIITSDEETDYSDSF